MKKNYFLVNINVLLITSCQIQNIVPTYQRIREIAFFPLLSHEKINIYIYIYIYIYILYNSCNIPS